MMFFRFSFLFLFLVSCSHVTTDAFTKSDRLLQKYDDVKTIVDALALDPIEKKMNTGMIIAVVLPNADYVFSYGIQDESNQRKITEDSIFQVGSLTKVFTSHLLALMAQDGNIRWDEEISSYFPQTFHPKDPLLSKITFRQLAYHKAGFPLIHQTWAMRWNALSFLFKGNNIWEDCTEEVFINYITNMELAVNEEHPYQYSSLGYTFIGWLLGEMNEKKGYDSLLVEKILKPLGLKDTTFDLNDEQKTRLVLGHAGDYPPLMLRGRVIDPWRLHQKVRAGGGLHSSLRDLVRFLKFHMGKLHNEYYPAMLFTHEQVVSIEKEGRKGEVWFGGNLEKGKSAGMGWFGKKTTDANAKMIFVQGTFAGNKSFMGFSEDNKIGVVILQNNLNATDGIGLRLLEILIGSGLGI